VANRSDLVVFWFCDPETSHPRLLERLSRSGGRKRQIVVIDEFANNSANKADNFLKVSRDQAAAVVAVLRAVLKGLLLDAELVRSGTGLELSQLQSLADKLRSANYGSIFFGQTTADSSFDPVTDSLSLMVRELNNLTRFVGIKLRSDANAQGAEDVLAWSSGYPFAINHSLGFPRFNWLEHSAETVLRRRECDAVLFATGADLPQSLAGLSRNSREFLGTIPTIALSPIVNFPSTVSIQVSTPGLDGDGEFCRFDGVSLPLKADSTQSSGSVDSEIALQALRQVIGSLASTTN
jgi:formylmethanofuran dehydrogenase subunit B